MSKNLDRKFGLFALCLLLFLSFAFNIVKAEELTCDIKVQNYVETEESLELCLNETTDESETIENVDEELNDTNLDTDTQTITNDEITNNVEDDTTNLLDDQNNSDNTIDEENLDVDNEETPVIEDNKELENIDESDIVEESNNDTNQDTMENVLEEEQKEDTIPSVSNDLNEQNNNKEMVKVEEEYVEIKTDIIEVVPNYEINKDENLEGIGTTELNLEFEEEIVLSPVSLEEKTKEETNQLYNAKKPIINKTNSIKLRKTNKTNIKKNNNKESNINNNIAKKDNEIQNQEEIKEDQVINSIDNKILDNNEDTKNIDEVAINTKKAKDNNQKKINNYLYKKPPLTSLIDYRIIIVLVLSLLIIILSIKLELED